MIDFSVSLPLKSINKTVRNIAKQTNLKVCVKASGEKFNKSEFLQKSIKFLLYLLKDFIAVTESKNFEPAKITGLPQ
jgi:hypothetical protein